MNASNFRGVYFAQIKNIDIFATIFIYKNTYETF